MNVVAFLIAMGLFVFGMWLMSIAPELAGFQAVDLLRRHPVRRLALAIPINLLGRGDGV